MKVKFKSHDVEEEREQQSIQAHQNNTTRILFAKKGFIFQNPREVASFCVCNLTLHWMPSMSACQAPDGGQHPKRAFSTEEKLQTYMSDDSRHGQTIGLGKDIGDD